jgi:hypothetical protein
MVGYGQKPSDSMGRGLHKAGLQLLNISKIFGQLETVANKPVTKW